MPSLTRHSDREFEREGAASRRAIFLLCISSILFFWLTGCAGYAYRVRGPRSHFEAGRFEDATKELRELADKKDNDQLLYLLDLALVEHTAGQYANAIETFQRAEKLADELDYVSVTQEAGSVVLNDNVKPYRALMFERILINAYLAIDYALLGRREDALVECRRVNHRVDIDVRKGGKRYQYNPFAKYLAAVLFESQKSYNDAFVDYRVLHDWKVASPILAPALLRMAQRFHANQEYAEFTKRYPTAKPYPIAGAGEVVLLFEQGRAPFKVPSPASRLVPIFVKNHYESDVVRLHAGSRYTTDSSPLFDVEATAIHELEDNLAAIIAKKAAGVVAKEVIANQVEKETNSPFWGFVTRLFLHGSDGADLRSWTTLPARLQIARLVLPPGRYDLSLDMVQRSGLLIPNVKRYENIEVRANTIQFLNYRALE